MSEVSFSKWQGLGNDFVLCRAADMQSIDDLSKTARSWCDRHWGIGADGLILAGPGKTGESQLTMEIYNADGSAAAMCGNGIRCLAAWAAQQGWVKDDGFAIGTRSGLKWVNVKKEEAGRWQVEVDMGEPRILASAQSGAVGGAEVTEYVVSMGNLHRVVLPDLAEGLGESWLQGLNADDTGRALENSAYGECNVEFAVRKNCEELQMRVRERGVGETMACGTGACAVLTAASLHGWCPRRALIRLRGGDLAVRWEEDNRVMMRGPAVQVFEGNISL